MEYTHDPVAPKGSEMAWHKNGQLRLTVPLQKGQRHGIAVIFSEDGKRWSEQTWVTGQQQGIERRLGPSGDVIRTLTWAHGKVVADTAEPAGR
jgi:antitoxin component YwqK of YwqJK toxin-antitoxin module